LESRQSIHYNCFYHHFVSSSCSRGSYFCTLLNQPAPLTPSALLHCSHMH
jgi:hypothetical protein